MSDQSKHNLSLTGLFAAFLFLWVPAAGSYTISMTEQLSLADGASLITFVISGDPALTSLRDWEIFCVVMVDLDNRMGWDLYISAEN